MGAQTGMSFRVIKDAGCVAEGAQWLAGRDDRFADLLRQTGELPLRLRADGFAQLFSAIISQQVSTASAAAIWARLEQAGLDQQAAVQQASEDDLRACGLSRQKIRYGKALAEAGIDFNRLRDLPDADVIKTLVAVPGIGPWTAEVYAMFSLGRSGRSNSTFAASCNARSPGANTSARPSENIA